MKYTGADGEPEEIDDLEKGGIIAAAQSKDLSFALIKKVSGTLDGTLEAKDADGQNLHKRRKIHPYRLRKKKLFRHYEVKRKLFVCTGVK